MIRRPHTLIINRSDSRCGNCGRSADPKEPTHEKVLGYSPGEGCHQRFVLMDSDYMGIGMREACERLRSDLTWVGAE